MAARAMSGEATAASAEFPNDRSSGLPGLGRLPRQPPQRPPSPSTRSACLPLIGCALSGHLSERFCQIPRRCRSCTSVSGRWPTTTSFSTRAVRVSYGVPHEQTAVRGRRTQPHAQIAAPAEHHDGARLTEPAHRAGCSAAGPLAISTEHEIADRSHSRFQRKAPPSASAARQDAQRGCVRRRAPVDMGIRAALREVYSNANEQPCCNHQIVNVVDQVPNRNQWEAKQKLSHAASGSATQQAEGPRRTFQSCARRERLKPRAGLIEDD